MENVAREPEIVDLATFLNNMGAHIRGAGTNEIRVQGVDSLKSMNVHTIIPDRIEAGTYLSFAAANGNGVLVKNVITEHLIRFCPNWRKWAFEWKSMRMRFMFRAETF